MALPTCFQFTEAFSKGVFGASRRFRLLELPLALLPGMTLWLSHCIATLPANVPWLSLYFSSANKLEAALSFLA